MIVLNPLLIGRLPILQGLAAASSVVTSSANTQCVGKGEFAHRLSSEDNEPTTPSADAGKRSSHRLNFFGDALHIARAIIAGAYDRVRNFSAPDNCGGMVPALACDTGMRGPLTGGRVNLALSPHEQGL